MPTSDPVRVSFIDSPSTPTVLAMPKSTSFKSGGSPAFSTSCSGFRLEVTMHNASLVRGGQTCAELTHDLHHLAKR